MTMQHQATCNYCNEPVEGKPWVILNRALFGSGRSWMASEFRNEAGEYWWDFDNDDDPCASGPVLCFPACLQTFIEGRMISADIQTGNNDEEQP